MSTTFYKLSIKDVIKETADTVSISFNIPNELKEKFTFRAGQYLTLRTYIDGEEIRRAYSLSTSPNENEWRVAIKRVKNGKFSSYAQKLKAGDEIEVMAPLGNFTVNSDEPKNYVLYAAGSGITPIISIAKYLVEANDANRITLFYGNKTESDTIYKEELDQLAAQNNHIKVVYLFSRQNVENELLKGRIDKQKVKDLYEAYLKGQDVNEVYVCGPEEMIFAVKEFYTELGLDAKHIHFELFNVAAPEKEDIIDESKEITSHVTVIIDDEEFEFDLSSKGKDILQAAQDIDADVPFSCKGGVCCTCKAKVLEGKVKMDLNYALDPEEVEEGFVLTCQSHPLTEKVVISYDEY
jgi:ring-1,2-phenylacetyl-CoA epoxidase subunit PaaE